MRILVRSPNWIGDQILAFPFFYYLRKAFPEATIAVACVPWVQAVQFLDLVDQVYLLPKPFQPGLKPRLDALESCARSLREGGRWDLAISLPDSFSSACLLWRAGALERRGYRAEGRSLLLTQRLEKNPWDHRSQAYLRLLPDGICPAFSGPEFWGKKARDELEEDVPGELLRFDAERSWRDSEILEPPAPEQGYWVLAPGSAAESRRWPVRRFAELAKIIQERTRLPGVIVGGPAEGFLADQLLEDSSLDLLDRTGLGSPASYWKIFRHARFTLSNDSGLAHVASLCGSPVQTVWGAGNPKRTEPIGPGRVRTLFHPVSCWPCEKNTCGRTDGPKLECLLGIQPEWVWSEIVELGKVR